MQIQWFYVIHTSTLQMGHRQKKNYWNTNVFTQFTFYYDSINDFFLSFSFARSHALLIIHSFVHNVHFVSGELDDQFVRRQQHFVSFTKQFIRKFLSYFYCCGIILLRAFLSLLSLESLANKYALYSMYFLC